MPLPSSGRIKLSEVRAELELSGPISLGQSRVRTLFRKPGNPIKLSDGYSKSNSFYITINSNTADLNLGTLATANGWDGQARIFCTINNNVWIYGTNALYPALTTPYTPYGIVLTNYGYIVGKGGQGGASNGGIAESGGNAIVINSNISISNYGYIAGGGGGGGGGIYQYNRPGRGIILGGGGGAGGGAGGGTGLYTVQFSGGAGGSLNGIGSDGRGYDMPLDENNVPYDVYNTGGKGGYSGGGGGAGADYGRGFLTGGAGGGGGINFSIGTGGSGAVTGRYGSRGGNGGTLGNIGESPGSLQSLATGAGGGGGFGASGGLGYSRVEGGSAFLGYPGSGGYCVSTNGYSVTWNVTGVRYGAIGQEGQVGTPSGPPSP